MPVIFISGISGKRGELTMEQKITKINNWFEEQIAACGRRNAELQADDRTDEAIFEKVKANIYDAMRTWLNVAVRVGNGNGKAVKDFFIARVEQIPASWETAYEKAKEHNDAARMQTEQVKLDVVREVRAEFDQIWEGAE